MSCRLLGWYTVTPADVVACAGGANERKRDSGDMLADDLIECRLELAALLRPLPKHSCFRARMANSLNAPRWISPRRRGVPQEATQPRQVLFMLGQQHFDQTMQMLQANVVQCAVLPSCGCRPMTATLAGAR